MVKTTFDQARRMGAPRAEALCLNFGGALDFQTGRWEEAETGLRRAVDLYRQLGSASGEALSLQRLGVLLTARGRVDEAWSLLGEGVAVAERATMRSHCLTRLYATMARNRLAAGDTDGARRSLDEGAVVAARHGACVTCNALLLPEAVRVGLATDRQDEAEAAATELEALAEKNRSRAWTGMARQARARVLRARGTKAAKREAAAAFRQAAAAFREARNPYEAARCLAGAAEAEGGGAAAMAPIREALAEVGAAGIEG